MQTAAKRRLTAQEYLALERGADIKSEFLNGEMFAMAGGTRRHSRIAVNFAGALNRRLAAGPCQTFNSDMRVKIQTTGLYTYPDVHVACGELRFEDEVEDVLLNPKVIVEVLSESSDAWDRGRKFWHYRQLESLAEYVLVSQDVWLVERYVRQADGKWVLETAEGGKGVLHLKILKCKIPLTEIYDNTGVSPEVKPPNVEPPSVTGRGKDGERIRPGR